MSEQWTDEQLETMLDEGLEGLPMVALPAFFIQNTMRQIQPAAIRFKLQWVDIGLPIAGTMLFGIVYWLYLVGRGGATWVTTIDTLIGWEVVGLVLAELAIVGVLAFYLWGDDETEWVLNN